MPTYATTTILIGGRCVEVSDEAVLKGEGTRKNHSYHAVLRDGVQIKVEALTARVLKSGPPARDASHADMDAWKRALTALGVAATKIRRQGHQARVQATACVPAFASDSDDSEVSEVSEVAPAEAAAEAEAEAKQRAEAAAAAAAAAQEKAAADEAAERARVQAAEVAAAEKAKLAEAEGKLAEALQRISLLEGEPQPCEAPPKPPPKSSAQRPVSLDYENATDATVSQRVVCNRPEWLVRERGLRARATQSLR